MSSLPIIPVLVTALALTGCASATFRMDASTIPPVQVEEPAQTEEPVATAAESEQATSAPTVPLDAMQPGQNYRALRRAESDEVASTLHGVFVRYDHSDPARPQAVFHNAIMESRHIKIHTPPPILAKLPYLSRLFNTTGVPLEPAYELEFGECSVPLSDLHRIESVPRESALLMELTEASESQHAKSTSVQIKRGDEVVKGRRGVDFDFNDPGAK